MTRSRFLLTAGLALVAACSGSSNGNGRDGLPRNAPFDPTLVSIRATTGRANLASVALPFATKEISTFDEPFAMAFLPDGRLLVTEKAGTLKLRGVSGELADVKFVPPVAKGGQGGLLDVAIAPDFATSRTIYLTYSEPGAKGSALALMRATLSETPESLGLSKTDVIWRSGSNGPGGQFGANILFSPDGKYLFLSSGERQRFTPAQDPKQALGKILRLTLDGKAAPGNPMYDKGGVEAMTWSTGHRNPYGMVFTPDGRLWEEEMGPRGGDELNLILPGGNYGWPIVSNGDNYSGQPIPDHPSRPDLAAPKLWWNPSISPGGMIYYSGAMFPKFTGSLLIGALSGEALIRVALDGDKATAAEQWDLGARIRDVAQAPDGSIWLLEDEGKLVRLSPKA
ncbi:MAG: PQQ-dependent sugar dehydrogenase [Pseudomonadota bacterium]